MPAAYRNLATWFWAALLAGVLLLWWASYWPAVRSHAFQAIDAGEQLRHGYFNWGTSSGSITVLRVRRCDDGRVNVAPAGRAMGLSWQSWPVYRFHRHSELPAYFRIDFAEVPLAWLAAPLAAATLIA